MKKPLSRPLFLSLIAIYAICAILMHVNAVQAPEPKQISPIFTIAVMLAAVYILVQFDRQDRIIEMYEDNIIRQANDAIAYRAQERIARKRFIERLEVYKNATVDPEQNLRMMQLLIEARDILRIPHDERLEGIEAPVMSDPLPPEVVQEVDEATRRAGQIALNASSVDVRLSDIMPAEATSDKT